MSKQKLTQYNFDTRLNSSVTTPNTFDYSSLCCYHVKMSVWLNSWILLHQYDQANDLVCALPMFFQYEIKQRISKPMMTRNLLLNSVKNVFLYILFVLFDTTVTEPSTQRDSDDCVGKIKRVHKQLTSR